jgi:hypothetical protein
MSIRQSGIASATRSSSLADILERVLDKGVVIAGDIKIKLVEIELLTIQIRLVICSVERAMEMGMDWWRTDPNWSALARQAAVLSPGSVDNGTTVLAEHETSEKALGTAPAPPPALAAMEQRLGDMEATLRRLEEKLTAKS